jgi:hypothetical protein
MIVNMLQCCSWIIIFKLSRYLEIVFDVDMLSTQILTEFFLINLPKWIFINGLKV